MKWETLINFPAEQSIKAPPFCSDSHCGSKGRNYIVKNSSCPGWQQPPWKVTCDWHSVWGGEPGLADRVEKAKGKSEISLLTITTQPQIAPLEGSYNPLVILTIEVSSWQNLPSEFHQRFRTCLAPIYSQTQRKRKRKRKTAQPVGVCSCRDRGVCVHVWVYVNAWEFFYIKRKTLNVLSTLSFLMTTKLQSLFA